MSTVDQTHMADWPHGRRGERTCPHGVGHPHFAELPTDVLGHGCDGCCRAPAPADQAAPQTERVIEVTLTDTSEIWRVPGVAVALPRIQDDHTREDER